MILLPWIGFLILLSYMLGGCRFILMKKVVSRMMKTLIEYPLQLVISLSLWNHFHVLESNPKERVQDSIFLSASLSVRSDQDEPLFDFFLIMKATFDPSFV